MKKIFLTLSVSLVLMGCNNNKLSQAEAFLEAMDSILNTADSIQVETKTDTAAVQDAFSYEEFDISELPASADEQDRIFNHVLYVNEDETPDENGLAGVYTVWVADERWGVTRKILTTNPAAEAQWSRMSGKEADGVAVSMNMIAAASSASYASEDFSKIVVEGCPDGRNTWTYIIDIPKHTAIQLPSTEGVQDIDMDEGEIIAASYGYYPEGGRYTVNKAYSLDGKFLRQVGDPQPE